MKKLYFIRHGITEMNELGLISGITETPLSKTGKLQAKTAGQEAKLLNIDCIVSSPMNRAVETARIIAKEIGYPLDNIHISKLLIERDFGELEGKVWSPDLNLDGIADIETVDTILARASLAIKWLESLDAQTILVVAHGGIGRALRHHLVEDMPYSNGPSPEGHRMHNAVIHRWV